MQKTVKGKLYDTEKMTVVKKVTFGEYGDPAGYEEILFAAADGTEFLYCNGGEQSPYAKEAITNAKAKVEAWKKAHA